LTFAPHRAILAALMRRLGLTMLALLALPLAGCGSPCQDLGDRLCACSGGGTSSDTCKQQIANLLKDVGVGADDEAFCTAKLATCQVPPEPANVEFCEWLQTETGRVSCGLANPPVAASFPPGTP
jgi:hypothetical protein